MNRTKLYVSAALFLCITVFKLAVPTAASDLRERLLPAISSDVDYMQTLNDIGVHLTAEESPLPVSEEVEELLPDQKITLTHPAEHLQTHYPWIYEELMTPTEDTAAPDSAEPPPAAEPEIPAVVSTFLESQAAYSGYSVPETVSYAFDELPFEFTSPVEGMASSGFGYRVHPIFGEVKFHYGTDFSAWTGTSIQAFADGYVLAAGNSDSYGLYLILNHGNGWTTLYAHCSELLVTEGSAVTMGQQIALAGETGQATGPHLHFELMCNNIYYNPEFYINS